MDLIPTQLAKDFNPLQYFSILLEKGITEWCPSKD
jgi:hypothetical protein